MNKYLRMILDPKFRFSVLASRGKLNHLSDEAFLKKAFRLYMGKKLDLSDPRTFNEKLQWLKLHDRKPIYTTMVDKFTSKKYVADLIGEEYVVPALGGPWASFDEIDFDALPDRFVLKTNHDSGGVIVCRDKATLDKEKARAFFEKHLARNYYWSNREWPYKDVKPCIFAEEFMEDGKTGELRDYKFFCFNGEVKALFVATERQKAGEEVKFDFFDAEYRHLPLRQGHPNAKTPPEKPAYFEEMKRLASKLSQGFPQLRVDFYEANGKIYFGELTFFHFSGMVPFLPEEWDKTLGGWITLPEKTENGVQ